VLSEARGKQLWEDLTSSDAEVTYKAIWELIQAKDQAVELLGKHLSPSAAPDVAAIKRYIADLDNDKFQTREHAFNELRKLGAIPFEQLRAKLKANPSLETRRRIEALLTQIDSSPPAADLLRQLRSIQVMEAIHSEKALKLLREIATGSPASKQTDEAKAVLKRFSVQEHP
jgi:hypothetical protein